MKKKISQRTPSQSDLNYEIELDRHSSTDDPGSKTPFRSSSSYKFTALFFIFLFARTCKKCRQKCYTAVWKFEEKNLKFPLERSHLVVLTSFSAHSHTTFREKEHRQISHLLTQSRLSLKILPLGFSFHLRASVGRENRFSLASPTSTLILSPPTKITRRRSGAEFFALIITFFDLELGKIFSGFFWKFTRTKVHLRGCLDKKKYK